MPSEPVIDIAALTAPIPGSDPAGSSTPFTIRQQLDEARKEIDLSGYAADDPMRPTEAKKADWGLIQRLATETLTTTAKDLLVAARLTEALVRLHGFAGLRDGLSLLRALVTDCWERLAPKIDDPSDLDIRAAPFEWLDDPDHGARFPATIRAVPLVVGENGAAFGWLDWKKAQDGKDRGKYDAFEKAVSLTRGDQIREAGARLDEAARELDGLTIALAERLKGLAPSLSSIRAAIADCKTLADQIVLRKGPAATPNPAPRSTTAAPETEPMTAAAAPMPQTREAVYQVIADAAQTLETLEPHSPIPYLLRRCVELGRQPFPEMIRSFVRNEEILKELRREIGIPEQDEKPA
jgi:type VI secretion system protein ImpA